MLWCLQRDRDELAQAPSPWQLVKSPFYSAQLHNGLLQFGSNTEDTRNKGHRHERSMDATKGAPGLTTSNKKLLETSANLSAEVAARSLTCSPPVSSNVRITKPGRQFHTERFKASSKVQSFRKHEATKQNVSLVLLATLRNRFQEFPIRFKALIGPKAVVDSMKGQQHRLRAREEADIPTVSAPQLLHVKEKQCLTFFLFISVFRPLRPYVIYVYMQIYVRSLLEKLVLDILGSSNTG